MCNSKILFFVICSVFFNSRPMTGDDQLLYAIESNNVELAQAALESGASPNVLDRNKDSCLYKAAESGCLELVDLLIAKGATVNQKCCVGWSPLSRAICKNHVQIVKALLEAKATPNSKDHCLVTPLHEAVTVANLEIIQLLFAAKVNPFVKDKWGKTATDLVKKKHAHDMGKLISDYKSDIKLKATRAVLFILKRIYQTKSDDNCSELPSDVVNAIIDYTLC
ncbi:ankyrin repeat domain-containing protein [Candidatus Dependentiae bacterium]|nr:ankyrin repeat domain-containing protein [Candidatus Dependentiae bacterium]